MEIDRRDFVGSAVAAGLGLLAAGAPLNALAQAAGGESDVSFVHPELRAAARTILRAGRFEFSTENLARLRSGEGMRALVSLLKPPLERSDIPVAERRLPVPGGPDVLVYLINARPGGSRPAIVHMHGGGFVIGSAKSGLASLKDLAAQLDCTIATVEYRLAPETRYAGSLEDNYAALRWVHGHAAELGVDRKRIAVMGESAGGGHAALLAITARDRGEVPLALQCLIYPMLDDRTGITRAPGKNMGALGWNARANRYGWASFLGGEPGVAQVPPAVPARLGDLAGLAPTFIAVGAIDLLADEDVEYARRLMVAGVPTELLVIPGAFHGFDVLASETNVARRLTAAKINALREALAIYADT